MFNSSQLEWIKEQAREYGEDQENQLECLLTMEGLHEDTLAEDKLTCVSGMEFAEGIINKVDMLLQDQELTNYVALDADHWGELIVRCDKIWKAWSNNENDCICGIGCMDLMVMCRQLGSIEGRLKTGCVTNKDIEMLDGWAEDLEL